MAPTVSCWSAKPGHTPSSNQAHCGLRLEWGIPHDPANLSGAAAARMPAAAGRQVDLPPLRAAGGDCRGPQPRQQLRYRRGLPVHAGLPARAGRPGRATGKRSSHPGRRPGRASRTGRNPGCWKLRVHHAHAVRDPGGAGFHQPHERGRVAVQAAHGSHHAASGDHGRLDSGARRALPAARGPAARASEPSSTICRSRARR